MMVGEERVEVAERVAAGVEGHNLVVEELGFVGQDRNRR